MNRLFYIIALLSLSRQFLGQTNLVTNPSFENYSMCPNDQGQASLAVGWNAAGDTPDYFNTCSTTFTNFGVPINWGGYQVPASGNAYCGIGVYESKIYGENIREYVYSQLTTTLAIGTKYFVSFKTSATNSSIIWCYCAIKNMSALFTTTPFTMINPITTNYSSQINHNSIISDTLNWTKVIGSFVADSNYQYISLGNFKTDINTDTLILNGGTTCTSYYFLDDICVSTDSLFAFQYNTVGLKTNYLDNNFSIYPNPTNGNILIKFSGYKNLKEIKLFDFFGHLLVTKSNITDNKIDLSGIAVGIYFIQINFDDKIYFDKIVVQN